MITRINSLLFVSVVGAFLVQSAHATRITFDNAAGGNNEDIPLNYGSNIAGNSTGFVTTDGSGATPKIGLTWLGNVPDEWEYHTATTWTHESPVHVAQIDQNRFEGKDGVSEILFKPIDGRSVVINSFLLSGANNQGGTAEWTWEVVGTAFSNTVNVPNDGNTGTINVGFTGTPGSAYTLRFTRTPSEIDSGFGTALDDLSFSETLQAGAPVFKLTVDRSTGGITLTNIGSSAVNIKGYSITSEAGSMNQTGWKSISGNYDVNGNKSVDINDDWTKLPQAGTNSDLSEYEFGGNGGTIAASASVVLNQASPNPKGIAWLKSPFEDLKLDLVLANGNINQYSVEYVNGPTSGYAIGDLNFDGSVTALDWPIFNAGRGVDLLNKSLAAAYQQGDLDGDKDNDIVDFVLFKSLFIASQGAAAWAALEAIPEPTSGLLVITALVSCLGVRPGRREKSPSSHFQHQRRYFVKSQCIALIGALALLFTLAGPSRATILNFNMNAAGAIPASNSDINTTYGSNITAGNIIGATAGAEGFTPNIALTWAPTGGVTPGGPDIDILEFHSAASFSGAGFNVPVLQFDLDLSQHSELPADPTIDFTVSGGKALKLNSFKIGNATDQGEPAYSWTINLIRLSDMSTVATQTTGLLSAGSMETVTFNYTGNNNESYRLHFDDGGANTVRSAIDDLNFAEVTGGVTPQLKLIVNTTTGNVSLENTSGQNFDIDSYEITSSTNSLNPSGWSSLQDKDFEGNGAPGTGNGWEEAGGIGAHQLIESYGFGSSVFANGMTPISLGNAFDTSKPANVSFGYHVTGTGGFLTGAAVEFISPVVDADFDNDGDVDGKDFLIWQRGFGLTGSATNSQGDADGDMDVDGQDLAAWKGTYGNSSLAAASAAVPEPNTAGLLVFGLIAASLSFRRKRTSSEEPTMMGNSFMLLPLACLAMTICSTELALAAKTTDRLYKFGDGATSNTLDSVSQSSSDQQNLSVGFGGTSPTYVNVSSTGLNRPGAATGDLGAQFNGINNVLSGTPLNRPDETGGPDFVGIGPLLFPFPYNYDNITARGLQMWVRPDASALGTHRQGIVFDTQAAGGVSITADGKWTQSNDSRVTDGLIGATVPVVGNQWYHVMHHVYRSVDPGAPQTLPGGSVLDAGFTSVVYVNGMAVSANNGNPTPGELDNGMRVGVLAVGAEEISGDGFTPVFDNYFKGVVDNLEMYVYGDNSSLAGPPAGQNYGTFNLLADNIWIADQIALIPNGGILRAGDINRDGFVNQGDVTPFVAGWMKEKRFQGALNEINVGDWQTWGWGDINLDGIVNLKDAIILDQQLQSGGLAGLDFNLLGTSVPEPGAFVLAFMGVTALMLRRAR
ncbi:PEP-CTERM sorting domain-containing protein [Bythopirellula polymerisocia]|uniref:PEP-CTERM motif protein n=1 Tax=Bythopirellula polymerisocia TaxID=2528003 RepID=A0A5C6CSM2_9BACT|nr:PEP-CTERM sorting domain-containing protein [Bythopirellula polymerisocia]TWU26086.1 PEP-CTERM motif protein [Bythopirellula polymerisocia]